MKLFLKRLYVILGKFQTVKYYVLCLAIFNSFTMLGSNVTIDGSKLDPVINYDIIPVQVNVKGIL
jgi:hypothetical protein